jgi:flagellar biosynthesis GTPase FlhF
VSAQRFIGANSREAMNQVRLALGEDALILSSRMTDAGVEILALAEELPAPATADFAALSERLLSEIQAMRQLIDSRGKPSPLLKWLLDAGFSANLSQELLGHSPPPLPDATPARLKTWLIQRLDSQLNQLADEAELFNEPTVIALVGPTGVGKTTTTAKLAARYVMRHGPDQVALVSTDSFRIGAHEQLRIYAQLLGVELHTLEPDAPLGPLLGGLADKRLVLIDTVGMSQRDARLVTQIHQLGSSGRAVRLMLVLNAASHGDTLDEVLHTYREAAHAAGCRLDDCIVSKCDEAARLGPVLDTLIRHDLRLNYLSTGQQVPEDLQLPGTSNFLQQALDTSRPSRFASAPGTSTSQRLNALVRGLMGQRKALLALRDSLIAHVDGFGPLLDAWPLMALPAAQQPARWDAFIRAQEPCAPVAAVWVTATQSSQRVVYQGERQRLGNLAGHAEAFGIRELRYRNRTARLTLSHLPVVLKSAPARAWFGTLQDSHSGQHLGQRYWLSVESQGLKEQAANLLLQLKHDELASLTARGKTQLLAMSAHLHAELRLYLAAGLAASAMRLANASDDWAFQARTQLLGLLPKKTRGHTGEILEGLLHLSAVTGSL